MNLHDIRQDYARQELSISDCLNSPIEQFIKWLNQAMESKVNEPTAMNLATVDENGRPSARIVLLKEVNENGFVFFSNYNSRKGQAIQHQAFAALTFFWAELERQVRVEGKIQKLLAQQSDEYFASRPYTSRVGAWASSQSEVLDKKSTLLTKAALIAAKHPINVPRPPHWGGYVLIPDVIEFWQGRPSRLHDRICYTLDENKNWQKVRLYP